MAIMRKGAREFVDKLVKAVDQTGFWPEERREFDESNLAKKVDGLLGEESKHRYTLEDSQTFCCAIGDNNPIHRSVAYAKRMNWHNTFVPGTLLAGRAEGLVANIIDAVNGEVGTNLVLTGQKTNFRDPVYHESTVDWEPNIRTGDESFSVGMKTSTKGEDKFFVDVGIGQRLFSDGLALYGPLAIGKYFITTEQLAAYCSGLGIKPGEQIPMNYVASFVTSLLLDKSKAYDGMPTGINRSTDYKFQRSASLGEIAVDLFLRRPPKSDAKGYLYKFDSVCSQSHMAVVSGNIVVLTDKELRGF